MPNSSNLNQARIANLFANNLGKAHVKAFADLLHSSDLFNFVLHLTSSSSPYFLQLSTSVQPADSI